jgi:uncharacterized protein (DUF2132 family)
MPTQPNNPLHGKTLQHILEALHAHYGWEAMAHQVNIRCFRDNPSIKSSLVFLRKTEWARKKVEQMYVDTFED